MKIDTMKSDGSSRVERCSVFLSGATLPPGQGKKGVVICADSGALPLYEKGYPIDFLIGDMDSLPDKYLSMIEKSGTDVIRHPVEKNMTDGELALQLAISMEPERMDIYGGKSGRIDHILATLQMLLTVPPGISTVLHMDDDDVILVPEGRWIRFDDINRKIISFLPARDDVIMYIHGLKYDLDGHELPFGSTRCIHNRRSGRSFSVRVEGGCAFMITSDDD